MSLAAMPQSCFVDSFVVFFLVRGFFYPRQIPVRSPWTF